MKSHQDPLDAAQQRGLWVWYVATCSRWVASTKGPPRELRGDLPVILFLNLDEKVIDILRHPALPDQGW